MLNGCLCCTLVSPLPPSRSSQVGRMGDALLELKGSLPPNQSLILEKYSPARIIVETSGSAFPAPIAIQIRKLTRENEGIHLDSIITVVDAVHFRGYEVLFSPLVRLAYPRIHPIQQNYKQSTPTSSS
jgi:G3E family GTPase